MNMDMGSIFARAVFGAVGCTYYIRWYHRFGLGFLWVIH